MSGQISFGRLAPQGSDGGGGDGEFRILVMADLTGRAGRDVREPVAGRRRINVDVDNWERVLGSLGAEVRIRAGGGEIVFKPSEIDDFHPDFLYSRLEVFAALRSLRERLMNSSTFDAAAAEVRSWARAAQSAETPQTEPASTESAGTESGGSGEGDNDLLGRLLGDRPAGATTPATTGGASAPASAIDSLIAGIVGPHIVPDSDKEQSALVAAVDEAVAAQMRGVLHDPGFQAVEAAWRGVEFLVARLETDEDLRLAVMDVSKDELAADVLAGDDLQATALYDMLVSQTHGTQGGKPWSLLCAGFVFDKTVADAAVLGRLSKIARAARAPIVAGAADRVAGCESIAAEPDPTRWTWQADADAEAAWQILAKLPEAAWLALGLPRMLMRQPYGSASDPVDAFDFEELGEGRSHEDLLWGSAGFALAESLGTAFSAEQWQMGAQVFHESDDLPAYVYTDRDGDRQIMPCAEVCLTDRAAQAIQELGLTALLSVRAQNVIRIRGISGLASPGAALSGPWSG